MNSETSLRLPTGRLLPTLRIVPADAVRLHEDADPRRVEVLARRLREEDLLRNPPIATALPSGGYVILDGANRTSALRLLGLQFQAVQVVDYAAADVRLEVWYHLLREDGTTVLAGAGSEDVTELDAADIERRLGEGGYACAVITEQGVHAIGRPAPVLDHVRVLRRIVSTYAGRVPIYRVRTIDLEALRAEYDEVGALVVFPRFTKPQILALADAPDKLPTGISRHVIPDRVLRLNLPLALLREPGSVEAKNATLRDLIHARLLAHRVRAYPESTILFDE